MYCCRGEVGYLQDAGRHYAMARKGFDQKLAALHALRTARDSEAAGAQLRTALRDGNNHIVGTAASMAAALNLGGLTDDLLAAFDRFMVDPTRTDPRCLAKEPIVKALRALGYRGGDVYLRGLAHVQHEPGWGGRADTAAGLRGASALALPDTLLDWREILTALTDGLADPEPLVRIDSAIAIDALNRPEGALLLRLKLALGDAERDVLAQCFGSYLSLAPPDAVAFVSRFLDSDREETQVEAASALAQCRQPEGIAVLAALWQQPVVSQTVRETIITSLGASPVPASADLLLQIVSADSVSLARAAIAAFCTSRFRTESAARLADVVAGRTDAGVRAAWQQAFGEGDHSPA